MVHKKTRVSVVIMTARTDVNGKSSLFAILQKRGEWNTNFTEFQEYPEWYEETVVGEVEPPFETVEQAIQRSVLAEIGHWWLYPEAWRELFENGPIRVKETEDIIYNAYVLKVAFARLSHFRLKASSGGLRLIYSPSELLNLPQNAESESHRQESNPNVPAVSSEVYQNIRAAFEATRSRDS